LWWEKNKKLRSERQLEQGRENRFLIRLTALQAVGRTNIPKCEKCGEKDVRILTVNHINGGGRKEAMQPNGHGWGKLCRAIYFGERCVDDLNVLCFNCNVLYEYERKARRLPENWKQIYQKAISGSVHR
jgi:hypothetical protein